MGIPPFPARRLILLGAFAAATAAAPAVVALSASDTVAPAPLAACTPGEENDVFTTVCTPFMVPNSPFTTQPGNPDVPEIDGIPCIGRSAGACVGLAEDAQAEGPPAIPRSTISSSP